MLGFLDKRIKVTFVDKSNDEILGVSKMIPDQLPDSFDKPTTFQFLEKEWQVIKADPVNKEDFRLTKKLTVYLSEVGFMDPQNILYTLPTISNEVPSTVDTKLFDDFVLELHEDDWRQIEFLPIDILPAIQGEMAAVEAILFPEDETERSFGYNSIHVRSKIGSRHLKIPFSDFCQLITVESKGSIAFSGYSGFVENGFAVHSNNYTYYGTLEGDVIKELGLQRFESVDDEFALVADKFELLLVSWCRGQITTV
jgi:hypothetical protein